MKLSVNEKREFIEMNNDTISMVRQCDLIGLSRSSYYYESVPEDPYNLSLMNLIDEQFTRTPFYGTPKMTAWLNRMGHHVNRKRVIRLMKLLGLEAIYPKPRLSLNGPNSKKYPYLLKDMDIELPDQVWCTDITYIRLQQGYVYLMAIMDWFSRYVISWEIATTLEQSFCLTALDMALNKAQPLIFNSDQGSQFTSIEFTERLKKNGIQISMDGRGRVYDNIFVERLWRSVKYEEVYLNQYNSVSHARNRLSSYFNFYNTERLHESLNYSTPYEIYFKKENIRNNLNQGLAIKMHLN